MHVSAVGNQQQLLFTGNAVQFFQWQSLTGLVEDADGTMRPLSHTHEFATKVS